MSRHWDEVERNREIWMQKPVLRQIYRGFYTAIAERVSVDLPGAIVEIGSGIGGIREVLPQCILTDIFPRPWLDRVENAYRLSFERESVSHVILFDVFHHLRYPGAAMDEFRRVLVRRGRVILFEPYMSILGLLAYGLAHHEPISVLQRIEWRPPSPWVPPSDDYYAAQGNATRVFERRTHQKQLSGWTVLEKRRTTELAYVSSGGYSKPQLFPDRWLPRIRRWEKALDRWPRLFATRVLVVLEKS